MSTPEGSIPNFSLERFATEVEVAANNQELIVAGAEATPEFWAEKGKPALTSLIAEGFMAIHVAPRGLTCEYVPRHVLTESSNLALGTLEGLLRLSGQYDMSQYAAVDARGILDKNKLPRGFRDIDPLNIHSEPGLEDYYSEYGLGFVRAFVKVPCSDSAETQRDAQLNSVLQKMRLNGSIDPDISSGLAAIRNGGDYTPDAYFAGVLELARITASSLRRKNEIMTRHAQPASTFRRWIRSKI
jgi:hypothetical protein